MRKVAMETMNGWLLVYLIGSLPLLAFYSMGLAGWFFDYPIWLFIGIFLVLIVPLVLLVLKVPSSPRWNIVLLWVGAGLILLRILSAALAIERALHRSESLVFTARTREDTCWKRLGRWLLAFLQR